MKTPLCKPSAKVLLVEMGSSATEVAEESKLHQMTTHSTFFKWFILANVLLLVVFCGYALWSLYQLENVMQPKENTINFNRYVDTHNEARGLNFDEWQKSVLHSLKGRVGDLRFLLNTLASIMKSLDSQDKKIQDQLLVANLTDFETRVLQELTRLKPSSRVRRTVRGGEDESGCNLNFSFDLRDGGSIQVVVSPKKGEKKVHVKSTVSDSVGMRTESELRECNFNIIHKPNTHA